MNSDCGLSFHVERASIPFLEMVLDRMQLMQPSLDRLAMEMDLRACHANACALDFAKLAQFETFSLLHDVQGIASNLNRRTGRLENCFLPRCALSEIRHV